MRTIKTKLYKKVILFGLIFVNLLIVNKKITKENPMDMFGLAVANADVPSPTTDLWTGGAGCCGSGCSGCCSGGSSAGAGTGAS